MFSPEEDQLRYYHREMLKNQKHFKREGQGNNIKIQNLSINSHLAIDGFGFNLEECDELEISLSNPESYLKSIVMNDL